MSLFDKLRELLFGPSQTEDPKLQAKTFANFGKSVSAGQAKAIKDVKSKKFKKMKFKGDTVLVNEDLAKELEKDGGSAEKEVAKALTKAKKKKAEKPVASKKVEPYTKEDWSRTFLEKDKKGK